MTSAAPHSFLICGGGSIGKRHIRNLQALGATKIVAYDPDPDRRREVESEYGIDVVAHMDDAWSRRPDAAVVAVPTSLHAQVAMQAAEHDCHLFIEKPLSDTLGSVDGLIELTQARRLITLVACNLRFHPGLMSVKRLIDDEVIGAIIAARLQFGQYLPDWRPGIDYRTTYSAQRELGGGVVLDAIHEIDYLRWLLGEVDTVGCLTAKAKHLETDTEDVAAIIMRMSSGAIGEIHLDYVQRTYRRTCQIIGERGTIWWDYTKHEIRWFSAVTTTWHTEQLPVGWQPNDMYVDQARHFLACLSRVERPVQDVREGRRVLEIAIAARESSASSRMVQTLRS